MFYYITVFYFFPYNFFRLLYFISHTDIKRQMYIQADAVYARLSAVRADIYLQSDSFLLSYRHNKTKGSIHNEKEKQQIFEGA